MIPNELFNGPYKSIDRKAQSNLRGSLGTTDAHTSKPAYQMSFWGVSISLSTCQRVLEPHIPMERRMGIGPVVGLMVRVLVLVGSL